MQRREVHPVTMKPTYRAIEQLIALIDEPNRSACFRMLSDHRQLFQHVYGSTNNHQNWPGGYFDHIQEAMNLAVVLHEQLNSIRTLPFTLSDLLLVVYLHDIEKPWKYELREDGQLHHTSSMQTREDQQRFRMAKLAEYSIVLSPGQANGIKYVEGEQDDYSSRKRIMSPLACLAHMCDVASARLWFDHPLPENDPWIGAERIRD